MAEARTPRGERLNGRVTHPDNRMCEADGCAARGEFKAPRQDSDLHGPPAWRWFCLDHVRAFNMRYNFFDGMTPDEIYEAQGGSPAWDRATRAFASNGYADRLRFEDSLEMIRLRFGQRAWANAQRKRRTPEGTPVSPADAIALSVLGLDARATRTDIRKRYAALVRRYHPDRNAGDRANEDRLSLVLEAYNRLKTASAFQTPKQETAA